MTGFGSALKAERERNGLTLEWVCEETRISLRNLDALEAEEYAAMPGGVFRRGIVKAYVNAVGLDETDWMDRFQTSYEEYVRSSGLHLEKEGDDAWAEFAENVRRSRKTEVRTNSLRWLGVVAMLLVLGAFAWAVWVYVLRSRVSLS